MNSIWSVAAGLVLRIFPLVKARLKLWRESARRIPDPALRAQALDSLERKAFHCLGGSVYTLSASADAMPQVLDAIVSIQTISDYLDNLVDNTGVCDEAAFRCVHRAFLDANLSGPSLGTEKDYYSLYPYKEDGGYLSDLVRAARSALGALPHWAELAGEAGRLANLYVELQVLKHLSPGIREPRLRRWAEREMSDLGIPSDLAWWEFSAACGSTLGLFYAAALASHSEGPPAWALPTTSGYFPNVTGLHILLDYYIDLDEDLAHGDFNFVSMYPDEAAAVAGVRKLYRRSIETVEGLPGRKVHDAVVRGLLPFYLSDPKVTDRPMRMDILGDDWLELTMFRGCQLLRLAGII